MNNKPYFYDDQGRLNIPVRAIPFGGPAYLEGKDFQGHHFSEKSDVGRDYVPYSYLDHNKLIDRYPELKSLPGLDEPIGEAVKSLTDAEGIVYTVIVNEAYAYQNMLKKLAEKHLIGASTTPFQRGVKIDEKSGHIDRWPVAEVALTWLMANPEADLYMKSIILEELNPMADENKDAVTEAGQTQTETQTQAESSTQAGSESPITDAVKEALEAQPNEKSIADMFGDLQAALEKSVELQVSASDARFAKLEKSVADIATALPLMARAIADSLKSTVGETSKKSALETIIEKSVAQQFQQKTPDQPASIAPGRERKANFGGKAAS